jgi:predicted nucleic acid-binding protein
MALMAVLDACVLYPIALTDILLRSAERGRFIPQWTERILEELSRNLLARPGISADDVTHRIGQMKEAFPEAMVSGWEHLEPLMTNHPKDRHVLAAAVHANASVIVTKNLQDFPEGACRPHEIEVLDPDELLCEFLLEDSDDMVALLVEQAADTQYPPISVEELLEHLTQHAPEFVASVRELRQYREIV